MQASTMRKNKIFMFLCVACIQECLTRERSPLQPFTFSTPELACACAQLVVAGTELTRAAERWPSLSRASPAHLLSRLLCFVLAWMPYITGLSSTAVGIFVPYDSNPCTLQPDSMHVLSGCTTLLPPSHTRLGARGASVIL